MDVNTITDVNALKALAYDQIAAKEQAENNLGLINRRIIQLTQVPQPVGATPKVPEDPTAPDAAASENASEPIDVKVETPSPTE